MTFFNYVVVQLINVCWLKITASFICLYYQWLFKCPLPPLYVTTAIPRSYLTGCTKHADFNLRKCGLHILQNRSFFGHTFSRYGNFVFGRKKLISWKNVILWCENVHMLVFRVGHFKGVQKIEFSFLTCDCIFQSCYTQFL